MKQLTFLSIVFLLSFISSDKREWQFDAGHSRLGFKVMHMGIAELNGSFDKVEIKATTTNADFTDAVIEMNADVSSINTGIITRDEHLGAEDFFNTAKYPKISFKSSSFKKKGKGYVIKGDFTMHGVTKTIELTATHNGTVKVEGAEVAGFQVSGTIKRSDFGVAPEFKGVADNVTLDADIEIFIE
jgi:polyisoprenoid-binding protein YceI